MYQGEGFFPHHEVHVGKDLGGRTVVVDGRWLQRSRTHQSFLAEEGRGEIVVDRDREKRADRQFAIGDGPGEEIAPLARTITHAMCEAFSGPEKNYHTDQEMARAL